MTRADAHATLAAMHGNRWCVVRWAWRFGRPTWTVEALWYAEQQLREYGPDYLRIEGRAERQTHDEHASFHV